MSKATKVGTTKPVIEHTIDDLESQFQDINKRLARARKTFLSTCEREFEEARDKLKAVEARLGKARTRAAKAAVKARKSGTRAARSELKKAQAARVVLADTVKDAKANMLTAQSRLHKAKPFDRKLAARTKVLARFEKDWVAKLDAEAAAKVARAKKSAAKRRATAKKRAARRTAGKRAR